MEQAGKPDSQEKLELPEPKVLVVKLDHLDQLVQLDQVANKGNKGLKVPAANQESEEKLASLVLLEKRALKADLAQVVLLDHLVKEDSQVILEPQDQLGPLESKAPEVRRDNQVSPVNLVLRVRRDLLEVLGHKDNKERGAGLEPLEFKVQLAQLGHKAQQVNEDPKAHEESQEILEIKAHRDLREREVAKDQLDHRDQLVQLVKRGLKVR